MASSSIALQGGDQVIKLLKELKSVPKQDKNKVINKAMRKGGGIMLKKAKQTLDAAIAINGDESLGLTKKNLKLRKKSGRKAKANFHYTIGVGNKKYPSGKKGATTRLNAARLEYGTSKQPATPWLRPAFNETKEEVVSTIMSELVVGLEQLANNTVRGG